MNQTIHRLQEISRQINQKSQDDEIQEIQNLLFETDLPISDEEAEILCGLKLPVDMYGLEWRLVELIESSPNWPIIHCLGESDNAWVKLLMKRIQNLEGV